jgi:hypothetical protein
MAVGYIFPRFGTLIKEKSGNPGLELTDKAAKIMKQKLNHGKKILKLKVSLAASNAPRLFGGQKPVQ